MFDFLKFKTQVAGVRSQLTSLDIQVKSKQAELECLYTSPPQKIDVIEHFEVLIDRGASSYDAGFKFAIDRLSDDPLNFSKTDGISLLTAPPPNNAPSLKTFEAAILALFRDEIKAEMRKRIEAMPWASDAGPLLADRPALIKTAELDLAKLKNTQADLKRQASEAGIVIGGQIVDLQ